MTASTGKGLSPNKLSVPSKTFHCIKASHVVQYATDTKIMKCCQLRCAIMPLGIFPSL